MRFLNKICHSLQVCLFHFHHIARLVTFPTWANHVVPTFRIVLHIFKIYIMKEATVEHRANSFHTTKKIQAFFSGLDPKCLRQFRLHLLCFPKRLDGCAMTRVCQSLVSGHQFTLWISLVEELLVLLNCTHPVHQRLKSVLERNYYM